MTEPKSIVKDGIEYVEFHTARKFLDYLQIRNERWLPENAFLSPWVFRGHADAGWELEPSALRPDNPWIKDIKQSYRAYVLDNFGNDYEEKYFNSVLQLFTEILAVREFIDLSDRVGHLLPEDLTINNYESLSRIGLQPIDIYLPIQELILGVREHSRNYFDPLQIEFALAQHHGVPTRLLDWTGHPFIATYFAAEEIKLKKVVPKSNKIAVWAINTKFAEYADLYELRHKRGKISYLNAQSGLFIFDRGANQYYHTNGKWRTFEQAVKDADSADKNKKKIESPILKKITVPITQIDELLRLLNVENVTRAHLMPTYDNITETLKLQRLINKSLE